MKEQQDWIDELQDEIEILVLEQLAVEEEQEKEEVITYHPFNSKLYFRGGPQYASCDAEEPDVKEVAPGKVKVKMVKEGASKPYFVTPLYCDPTAYGWVAKEQLREIEPSD